MAFMTVLILWTRIQRELHHSKIQREIPILMALTTVLILCTQFQREFQREPPIIIKLMHPLLFFQIIDLEEMLVHIKMDLPIFANFPLMVNRTNLHSTSRLSMSGSIQSHLCSIKVASPWTITQIKRYARNLLLKIISSKTHGLTIQHVYRR